MEQINVMISVLMPVFRPDANYLREAVESVLAQTYGDFELLLLCEGEFDEASNTYLESVTDPRVKRIAIPAKTGLPGSLNIGIEQAKGRYIARMDADDVACLDRFKKQIIYMESHPSIDILGGVVQVIGKKALLGSVFCKPMVRRVRMLFSNAGVIHPTVMFRRRIFDQLGLRYDTSRKGSEDYALWTAAIRKGANMDSLKDIVLNYRIHESQASVVLSEEIVAWDDEVRKDLWMCFNDWSKGQMDAILEFLKPIELSRKPRDYEKLLCRMIKRNERMHFADPKVFEKEILWQWFRQAVHQFRYGRNVDFLRATITRACLRPDHLGYIIMNYLAQFVENRRNDLSK